MIEAIASSQISSFHENQRQTKPHGHWRVDVVEGYGKRELNSCEYFNVHVGRIQNVGFRLQQNILKISNRLL